MRFTHRFIALLLLLAYASTGTALFPAVVMTLATLDGSHQVLVIQSKSGTQVRLHHDDSHFTPAVEDHATELARLLVSMCAPATEGDHSLSTHCVIGSLLLARDEAKRVTDAPQPLNQTATLEFLAQQPRPRAAHLLHPKQISSPDAHHEQHHGIASVRLLI